MRTKKSRREFIKNSVLGGTAVMVMPDLAGRTASALQPDQTAEPLKHLDNLEPGRYEDQYINRFGSHFGLMFNPIGGGVLPMGLGPIPGASRRPLTHGIYMAIEIGGKRYVLPLTACFPLDKTDTAITDFSLQRTMNRVVLRSGQFPPGTDISWEFISPFYPQDTKTSSAPFFYVRCRTRNTGDSVLSGRVLGGLEKWSRADEKEGRVTRQVVVSAKFRGPEEVPGKDFPVETALVVEGGNSSVSNVPDDSAQPYWTCLSRSFSVPPGQEVTVDFILAEYVLSTDIINSFGDVCRYEYQALFPSLNAVIDFARSDLQAIMTKSDRFDALIEGAALPTHIKDFIKKNFQIFLGSTWMLRPPDGQTIYTSYEGGARYFLSVDFEFNLAPFYTAFWPQCLASELDLWSRCYHLRASGTGKRPHAAGPKYRIMQHDIGAGFVMDEQVYIHGPMPVEENANFILMNELYYRYTGDLSVFRQYSRLCQDLADYIVESDKNGNGLSDVGTNNTLDSFSVLHKNYPDHVFLGIKAGCALESMARLLAAGGDTQTGEKYRRQAALIFATIEREAWQKDHYAITISNQKPQGWDSAFALTTNGLLYALLTGQPVPLEPQRVAADIRAQRNDYTKWPSMGVWRDMIGRYYGLGVDTFYDFRGDFRGDMYSRSFNSIAMVQAYPQIQIDMPNRRVAISESASGWFPLPTFADWKSGRIPWIRVQNGKVKIKDATPSASSMSYIVTKQIPGN